MSAGVKRKHFTIDSEEEAEEEESWQFDCVCGVKGANVDDGTEMVQCGKQECGLWFHSACVAIEDPDGNLHLPQVCWNCQEIKLDDAELAGRIAFLEYEYTVTQPRAAPNPTGAPAKPVAIEHNALCQVCGMGGELLCCDFCNLVFHLECLDPPLENVPDGKWACPECQTAPMV
eukprot:TRINITY_DN44378_c0_g1_i1.p1 TRINITY_DN44378_c0_g1~~TRINITY_DN44378_c0_g1_i1.p1  ORF type:complete len:174 (-),score=32.26 TRINITY_DN44378_c0_g1_i1:545-1066(-)